MAKQIGNDKGNSNPKVEKLELELGKVSYQLAAQGEVLQAAKKKFDEINDQGSKLVTEIKECLTKS